MRTSSASFVRSLLVMSALALIFSQVALASKEETAVAAFFQQETNHGTIISAELTAESLQYVKSEIGVDTSSASELEAEVANKIPQTQEEIRLLPELPGSELLGTGVNLREGVGMEAMTRPLIKTKEWTAFAADSSLFYRIPSWQVGRRNFRSDMTTKVFNSNQERLMDLAVSAGVEFELGMFSGSAEAKVQITKQNDRKTVISQASLDVGLYDLGTIRYNLEDLDQQLLAEFNQLPLYWTDAPLAFNEFVKKWGTHFVKTAEVGGAFEMVGTTTTSNDVDSLSIAANVKISLEMAIKVKAQGSVDYKSKNINEKYQNNFDFHARGGDPTVGALLASAHETKDKNGKMVDAIQLWLESVKKIPTIRSMKMGYLYELFSAVKSAGTARRQQALKQAIDVFMREKDISANVINVRPNQIKFSNFWRVSNQCLNFQAVIGGDSKLVVYLTSSARRVDLGYMIEIDSYGAAIRKGGKVVASTKSISAVTPGSSTLYSNYIVCFEAKTGNVLYGRANRVVLAFQDPRPELVFFYGFGNEGQTASALTALQLFDVNELECPAFNNQLCGGPTRGTCTPTRMCQCEAAYKGFACQQDCPLGTGNQVCSGSGTCILDFLQGDNSKPFCSCASGALGEMCDIRELPTLDLEVRPITPNRQLLSGRPASFSVLRAANDTRALAITPSSTQFSFQEADAGEPKVVKQIVAFSSFNPGTVTVTAQITFPNNPDVAQVTKTYTVLDCTCSGRGRCDAVGQCVCRAGSIGANCEEDTLTGIINVPASVNNVRTVTGRFSRRFGALPRSVEVFMYSGDEGSNTFNATVASFTEHEVTFMVLRTDANKGWDHPLRVMYRAVGARYVGTTKGTTKFAAADGKVVSRRVVIRFPQPYLEAPFVYAGVVRQHLNKGFQIAVVAVSSQSATLELTREDGTWNEPIEAHWSARPLGAADRYQHDLFAVGPRTSSPIEVHVPFPEVFRKIPSVELKAISAIKVEVFQVTLLEVNQGGFRAQIQRLDGDQPEKGWGQNLKLRWRAYPVGFDKATLKAAQAVELVENADILGHNLGSPIQLPVTATTSDCALACKQQNGCRGFTFHPRTPACTNDFNGGNGDFVPFALVVRRDSWDVQVKPAEKGGYVPIRYSRAGNLGNNLLKVTSLRDGRLLGVTHNNLIVMQRSLTSGWETIPGGCCFIAVTELKDGRLVAIGTNRNLFVKQSAAFGSAWIKKTGNNANTGAVSADELQKLGEARESENFVEMEAQSETEAEVDLSAYHEHSTVAIAARRPSHAQMMRAHQMIMEHIQKVQRAALEQKRRQEEAQRRAREAAAAHLRAVMDQIHGRNRRPPVRAPVRAPPPPAPTPAPTPAPFIGDVVVMDQFIDITQLVDGSLVAIGTNQHLYTLANLNGNWHQWYHAGSHSCCVTAITAHPDGGVIGVGRDSNWLYKKQFSIGDTWVEIPNSCCVSGVAGIVNKMSTGAVSEQPGRCYLKTIGTDRAVTENKCAVSGSFVKVDEDGEPVKRNVLSYSIRTVGFGRQCFNGHANSAFVLINGKRANLFRGINVFLVKRDGSFVFAQADTYGHDSWHTRGGGEKAVFAALQRVQDKEKAREHGVIGVLMACFDECANQLSNEMRDAIKRAGATGWNDLKFLAPALFIKDLRSGQVHVNAAASGIGNGNSNGCESMYRSGYFKMSTPRRRRSDESQSKSESKEAKSDD